MDKIEVGKVEHHYDKIIVAVVKLNDAMYVGMQCVDRGRND
jgi:hypothetical protein